MSAINLQAYYENIKLKTGKSPADFKKLAQKKGFITNGVLKPGVMAGEVIKWLKQDFEFGRGHGLALYHYFKNDE